MCMTIIHGERERERDDDKDRKKADIRTVSKSKGKTPQRTGKRKEQINRG